MDLFFSLRKWIFSLMTYRVTFFWGLRPQTPPGLCPWTPLGTSIPQTSCQFPLRNQNPGSAPGEKEVREEREVYTFPATARLPVGTRDDICSVNVALCCSPYVIGTMNQSSSSCHADLQMHHNFRWVLYANHIEPVRSFLGRYLRRQLAGCTGKTPAEVPGHGSGLMVVERVVEWLPKVWQRINRFLESHSSFDITIGLKYTTIIDCLIYLFITKHTYVFRQSFSLIITTRCYSADYAVVRCLSVRPSHAGILSKRLHISSNFPHCHCRIATSVSSYQTV